MGEHLEELRSIVSEATPANQWGARGWSMMEDDEAEPKAPRWHICANGVGTWPIGWTYEKRDAALIVSSVSLARAAVSKKAVEVLAKAICRASRISTGPHLTPHQVDSMVEMTWGDWLSEAQAALTALAGLAMGES